MVYVRTYQKTSCLYISNLVFKTFLSCLRQILIIPWLSFLISSSPPTATHLNLDDKMYAYFLHFTDHLEQVSCMLLPHKYVNDGTRFTDPITTIPFPSSTPPPQSQGEHILGQESGEYHPKQDLFR